MESRGSLCCPVNQEFTFSMGKCDTQNSIGQLMQPLSKMLHGVARPEDYSNSGMGKTRMVKGSGSFLEE